MSVADVNGARLWYEVAGEGPAVVFVHEAIGDARLWDDQWPEAFARFRALRYDLRGFGRSTLPGGPFSHTRDLRALLDHVGIDRAALVGGSVGASVCAELAIAEPERVTALVLAPPGIVGEERSDPVRRFVEAEEAAFLRRDLDEAVRLNLELWLAGPRRRLDAVDGAIVLRVTEMLRRAFEIDLDAYAREPQPRSDRLIDRLGDRLGEIRVSTLIVVGDEDVSDDIAAADAIAEAISGARKVVIHGTAHAPNLERPDEFNRVVCGFLDDVLAG